MNSQEVTAWAALIAVFVSLIGVIWNGIQTRKSLQQQELATRMQNELAEKNLIATHISRHRQEWVNSLRVEICEYVRMLTEARIRTQYFGHQPLQEHQQEFEDFMGRLDFSRTKIQLLLNTQEPESKELLEALKELGNLYSHESNDLYLEKRSRVTETVAKILKMEWERVKKLE